MSRARVPAATRTMILGLVAVLLSCGIGDDSMTVTSDDARFEVEVGERFSIVLESNPSTGYGWSLSAQPPRDVVRLVDDRYRGPDDDPVGSAGQQELVFEAVGDGSTYLQLWYVRTFDDPPEPAGRAQFEVIVGSGSPATSDSESDSDADADRPAPPIPDDESAITVSELLEQRPAGEIVVRGVAFDDGRGLVLCGVLAESFPPQCPGDAVSIVNPDDLDLVLESAGGVRWTDAPVVVLGVLTDDGLDVRLVG